MARIRWSLLLVAFSALAQAAGDAPDAKAAEPALGKIHQNEGIDVTEKFTGNATDGAGSHPKGWYDPDVCSGHYCVFSNQGVAAGRGMAVISTYNILEKMKRFEKHFGGGNKKFPDEVPYHVEETKGKGFGAIADKHLKRGAKLISLSPVLIIHRGFFNGTPEETQDLMLEKALSLLPSATKDLFLSQMAKPNKGYSPAQFIAAYALDTEMGFAADGRYEDETHLALYPELATIRHNCRPNVAHYLDGTHNLHATVARPLGPGEEITISFVEPTSPRTLRQQQTTQRWGAPCTCSVCSGGGNLKEMMESDARMDEIKSIEKLLWDPDSKGVTTALIARLVDLYKEERLEARLSDVMGLAAVGYSNLGYKKRAQKYARLAVQAGIIENGQDHPNVVAMGILAKDPVDHYSWQARIKKKVGKKA